VREDEARAGAPGPVRVPVQAVELVRVRLPLLRPFRTSRGETTLKDALLVRVLSPDGEGWGECGAEPTPSYSGETLESARVVLRDHLIPRVFAGAGFDDVRGNEFARGALECACLDAQLRASGRSLAAHLGGVRTSVEAGVAIGLVDDVTRLRALAREYIDAGYRRIKLKIAPGTDVEPVADVRAETGADVTLAVDANGAYALEQSRELAALDDYGLQCIEQPLAPDALREHALLAPRLRTRLALDESIVSARTAEAALAWKACAVVNVKWGRVGGIAEARRVHDVCVAAGAPAIIGGMLETGIGRAVSVAVASLPGFTEPGDLSASARYFPEDLTEPFTLVDGMITVPAGPGIGVTPRPEVLRRSTVRRETLRP
jgi:o-succinylbenzoate synthase